MAYESGVICCAAEAKGAGVPVLESADAGSSDSVSSEGRPSKRLRLSALPLPHITLYPTCSLVESANLTRLEALPGTMFKVSCMDHIAPRSASANADNPVYRSQLEHSAPAVFRFKLGARVLLIRQLISVISGTDVAAGSLGTIVGFSGLHSVVTTSSDLPAAVWVDVTFDCCKESEAVRVRMMDFSIASPDNLAVSVATRKQLPLLLGYAITIARAHGLTIEKVEVVWSLTNWRVVGHVYVGLSRCRSRGDLRVVGSRSSHVIVDDRSLAYHERLTKW